MQFFLHLVQHSRGAQSAPVIGVQAPLDIGPAHLHLNHPRITPARHPVIAHRNTDGFDHCSIDFLRHGAQGRSGGFGYISVMPVVRADRVAVVMLPLNQPAVLLDPVSDYEKGSPRTGFHQCVQYAGRILGAGAVVKSQRAGFVIGFIVSFSSARFGHHVPDFRVEQCHIHQGEMIRIQDLRRIMQHQGHSVKGKVRFFQGFLFAKAVQGCLIRFLVRPVVRQGLPDLFSQHSPDLVRIIKNIRQPDLFPGLHIIGPGGKLLGFQLLMISGSRLHQEAHPVEACPAVPDFHIQPAVFLAVVAGFRQIRSQLFCPGCGNAVDFLRHRRMCCFHVPQFDLRLVLLRGDLCLIGYFMAFLQGFRQGGTGCTRKQADHRKQNKRGSYRLSHHIPSHIIMRPAPRFHCWAASA